MSNRTLAWTVGFVFVVSATYLSATLYREDTYQNSITPSSTGMILDTLGSSTGTVTPRVRQVTMTADNFSFSPKVIEAFFGDTIDLNIISDGNHNFTIEQYGINQIIPLGETTIRFTAEKKGQFEFYCNKRDHRAKGMSGLLRVK